MEEVIVGRIARAHGLDGSLYLKPETDSPEALFVPGRVLKVQDPRPGCSPVLTVTEARPHGAGWLLRTEELEDRVAAEACAGHLISLPREELPELAPEEFFLHDLIGLRVVAEPRGELGQVTGVYDVPGGPLLSVSVGGKERLIPFRRETVVEVDLSGRELHVRLPEGLLEV